MLLRQIEGGRSGFAGWLSPSEVERIARSCELRTVAVDGMRELFAVGRCYTDLDRRYAHATPVGRFDDDREAISEWRRMLREGEL